MKIYKNFAVFASLAVSVWSGLTAPPAQAQQASDISASCPAFLGDASRDGEATPVTFHNDTGGMRHLAWIDFDRNPLLLSSVAPGESVAFNSYVGHLWLVLDDQMNCLRRLGLTTTSDKDRSLAISPLSDPSGPMYRGDMVMNPAGTHFLSFNPDGNLVVARRDGGYVWGLDTQPNVDFWAAEIVTISQDGRVGAFTGGGPGQSRPVWVAEGEAPIVRLALSDAGVLQGLGADGRVVWGTDGKTDPPGTAADTQTTQGNAPTPVDPATPVAGNTQEVTQPTNSPEVSVAEIGGNLPPLKELSTVQTISIQVPAKSPGVGTKWGCTKTIQPKDEDRIGSLALINELYQNGCYTDGRYNASNYTVGPVTFYNANFEKVEGLEGGYAISPAADPPKEFLGSRTIAYYQFDKAQDYAAYEFGPSFGLRKIGTIPASDVKLGDWTRIPFLDVSALTKPITVVIAPSSLDLSPLTPLGDGTAGAELAQSPMGRVDLYRYDLPGKPFDTATGFNFGPNTHENVYGSTRRFFPMQLGNQAAVIWQEPASKAIHLTIIAPDLRGRTTVALNNESKELLAAAATDGTGNVYYLTIQDGGTNKENRARSVHLYKADTGGRQILSKTLNAGPGGGGRGKPVGPLNMVSFGKNNAALEYANGHLGLMLSRTIHRTDDGLNHQSGSAFVFDANTLEMVADHGQTSGHSFGTVLTTDNAGNFLGIDLGDNYPRGVHLHRFSPAAMKSKVVFSTRVKHGESAASPAGRAYPPYPEISNGSKSFFKWSNDNNTYTELGGIAEISGGYAVSFVSEPDDQRRVLNNGLATGKYVNAARDIGFVLVARDFDTAARPILSNGSTEEGGFFDFGGKWSKVRNEGILWLTDYTNSATENASRLKMVPLPGGDLILFWEKWTLDSYVDTWMLRISADGTPKGEPVSLGVLSRLGRREDPLVIGDKVLLFSGDAVGDQLVMTAITPN